MMEHWWPTEIGYYDNPNHNKLNLVDYCYRNNTVYIGQIIEILNDQNQSMRTKSII